MGKRTVRMYTDRINDLPNDQPVVYKIKSREGGNIYSGGAGWRYGYTFSKS